MVGQIKFDQPYFFLYYYRYSINERSGWLIANLRDIFVTDTANINKLNASTANIDNLNASTAQINRAHT